MAFFDFKGLFRARGELNVARSIVGISRFISREFGNIGFNIRFGQAVRKKFGLRNINEAFSLINAIRDNVDQAGVVSLARDDALIDGDQFPLSSNVFGTDEGTDRLVVSGTVTIVDADDDIVGRIPFVLEADKLATKAEIRNMIGEEVFQRLDNSPKFQDDTFKKPFRPTTLELDFVARRS